MNINARRHPVQPLDKEGKMSGLGADAVWAGPFDSTAYPKGKGSSSGITGMKLRFADSNCKPGIITQKAKGRF